MAANKYLAALEEGEVPLILLFSGTVFSGALGSLSVQPVPWHKETQVRMPVAVWREAMDAHFPGQAWLRLEPARRTTASRRTAAGTGWSAGTTRSRGCSGGGRMTAPPSRALSTVARAVADAVLYEGYVLYPYRASSPKNQVRWQWGVLMPADVVEQRPVRAHVVPDVRGRRRRRQRAAR